MENDWTKRIKELEAERDKLRDDLSRDKAILQSLLDRYQTIYGDAGVLKDRDKEEILGYVKPDARAIEEELADYKAANASIREELRCRIKERDKLKEENTKLRAFWEWSRLADKMTFEQYHWKEASHES